MSETSGFFEAEYNESTGEYDREYFASQFANYFKLFFKNGVFGTPTNQLKVIAGEGLNVIVKEGWAFIDGYWYYNDEDLILPITPNTTAFARNDSIMCRLDIATRTINTLAFANTTDVVRDGSYYDLQLATLSLGVAATSISDSSINDKRTDESVCGLVTGVLKVETTADLFAQFNSQFKEWFDEIKGQLDEDAAGHLQQQIGLLSNLETQTKEDLVSAVNEVNEESVKYDDIVNDLGTALAVTEDGIPVGCGVVKELNDSLVANTIANTVNIASHTTLANAYVCPSDGYVRIGALYGINNYCNAAIFDANGTSIGSFSAVSNSTASATNMLFVKKGMKVYVGGYSINIAQFISIK